MVEEYDQQTNELLLRKRRSKTVLGANTPWEYLVGDAEPPAASTALGGGPDIMESSQNPIFSRRDVPTAFQWRVRNLPYPRDVYSVTIDHADRKIVIRTSNKKYFKRFGIPEMDAVGAPLEDSSLSWAHDNNTLVVSYAKPKRVMELEAEEA
eukprot:CAMPEP_0177581342 /NCGR_PEP_ID=MMETSP0419_2-20121207/2093_1 /TAXON_ID=582737 /ORGANISM="Tetraselmis sp., Strain GSL018" /LENGTH=151 /DNA_ID=CAMNT_0019070371 /DNA_START=129 /DNA_END=581 /DNA_ORIENTATION=+